jgi:O-glycosyl hydrolase
VHVDRGTKYQTIEGFGFFGARDAWWGPAGKLVDPAWVRLVIDDLGLTMWRNEYYPPAGSGGAQDADWGKQKPVALALRDQAAASGVPLKTILTVWSPPASMKCASDRDNVHEGAPHPGGTKDGGAVCPSQRDKFARWLIDGLKLYADIGIDVYALSFQNEPGFRQGFNSGHYPQSAYTDTLIAVGPKIRAAFPKVKLFGAENLLDIECGKNEVEFDPWWYTGNILAKPKALAELGAFAVHGYSDGVLATPTSKVARLWTSFHAAVAPAQRPIWMTETSGYVDTWEGGVNAKGERRPGAFDLAQAIFAALHYGKVSAWVWWQGSSSEAGNEFSLMQGTSGGRRYYASKHFYRFIRPGARMLRATSDDPEVLAVAFEHQGIGNFVTVLINAARSEKAVVLEGQKLPARLNAYVTSATRILGPQFTPVERDAITLPPRSLTTLISGSYLDQPQRRPGRDGKRDRPAPSKGAAPRRD